MLNNLFGTVGGTAWSPVMPMYVYCVTDDSDANPVFALSRVPHLVISPTVANSGSPSSSTADTDQSFFYFNSGTVLANYDQNPCVCIGSLEISKSALDAWTISTVHPIGDLREQTYYTFPGYGSGYLANNGGTAPTFSFNVYQYSISRQGVISVNINLANDGGIAGAGAVDTQVYLPIKFLADVNLSSVFVVGPATRQYSICATAPYYFVIRDTTSSINIQNNFFTAGPRGIATYFNYQLQVD
jgi:hypothetical protein